jgi:hypothetical protein
VSRGRDVELISLAVPTLDAADDCVDRSLEHLELLVLVCVIVRLRMRGIPAVPGLHLEELVVERDDAEDETIRSPDLLTLTRHRSSLSG